MDTMMRFPALPVVPTAFQTIDTPEKAYILGFLLADGCVMLPRPGICRSVINLKILAGDIQACLIAQGIAGGNIRLIENGYRATWEVNSDAIAADLTALGVTPKKTLTASLEWDRIPAALHGAVLAGLIDGDGHLRFDPSQRRAEISLVTASTALRDQLMARFPFFKLVVFAAGKTNRKRDLFQVIVESNRVNLAALVATVYTPLPFTILDRKQAVLAQIKGYLAAQDDYDRQMADVPRLKGTGKTIGAIAAEFGTSRRPIMDRLKANGVDSRRVVFTIDDRQEMARLHGQGLTVLQIHAAVGKGTEQAIRFHLQRLGCIQKGTRTLPRHPQADEIVRSYQGGRPAYMIAEDLGIDAGVVRRVLRAEHVPLTKGSPLKLTPGMLASAQQLLHQGRTLVSVADELGVSTTLIRSQLKELTVAAPEKDR
jgi:predicted transcriptional regulator